MNPRRIWSIVGLVVLLAVGLAGALIDYEGLKDRLACWNRYGVPERLLQPARPLSEPADFDAAVALNNRGVELEWRDRSRREEARELYRRAALMGLAVAQFNLANTYDFPGAEQEDYVQAASHHWRAVERGHPLAMISLAQLLERQDFGDLNQQLASARHDGDEDASDRIFLLKKGEEELAVSLMRQAAERGLPNAQYELAEMLRTKNKDEEREHWFRRAAKQGHAYAQLGLSGYYLDRGQNREALRWITMAAEAGVPHAQLGLGEVYLAGEIVPRDRERAAYWLARAAEKEPYVFPPDPRSCFMPYLHSRRPSFTAPAILNLRERAAAKLEKLRQTAR